MKKSLVPVICSLSALAFLLGACGSEGRDTSGGSSAQTPLPNKSNGTDNPPSTSGATFTNGVLTTKDVKVQITRYKVIQVGQEGNEYGEKPVIAFWYKTTNLSGARVDSTLGWILNLDARQGSNPDAETKLGPASAAPDHRLLYNQTKAIEKGRTVENAIAYELDDLITPVDVVATDSQGALIGKTIYALR
jgi:hypothetical protein